MKNGNAVLAPASDVEEIWENWRTACIADHGETTLPTHQLADFHIILDRKEAHHGFRNKQTNGRFHNQVTIHDPISGQSLVFNIYTQNPITH